MLYDKIRHIGSQRPGICGLTNVNKEIIPPRPILLAIQHEVAGCISDLYLFYFFGVCSRQVPVL